MRLGLIGLGRIGAFHAETLARLDRVRRAACSPTRMPTVTAAAAARLGASVADHRGTDGGRGAGVRCRRRGHRLGHGEHLELLEAALRAGVPAFCEKPVAADPAAAAHLVPLAPRRRRAGADRVSPPLRPRVPQSEGRSRRRTARPAHDRPIDDAGSRAAAGGLPRQLRWHLPRLLDPRPRHRALGDRAGGRRGIRHRQRWRRGVLSRAGRRRHRVDPAHPRRRNARRHLQHPLQRPRATTSVSSCTARSTPSRPVSTSRSRSAPPTRP